MSRDEARADRASIPSIRDPGGGEAPNRNRSDAGQFAPLDPTRRRPGPSRRWIRRVSVMRQSLACAAVLFSGCATETSGLARRPTEVSPPDPTPVPPALATNDGGTIAGEGKEPPASLSGSGGLTLVHGIVDGGHLFFCMRDAGTGQPLRGGQLEPPGGIPYGAAHELALDWDIERDGVELELAALTPAMAAGLGCAELSARLAEVGAPEPVDAGLEAGAAEAGAPLPPLSSEPATPRSAGNLAIPAGALTSGRHYALVPSGCASVGVEAAAEVCGQRDPLNGVQRALAFVETGSRRSIPGLDLNLQFLNASRALSAADIVLQGVSQGSQSVSLANEVRFGALRPREPVAVRAPAGIELHGSNAERADYVQSWDDTLSLSGIDSIDGERSYLLIYLGPHPSASAQPGLASPRFLLVAAR